MTTPVAVSLIDPLTNSDPFGGSSDPSRPDYTCPAYREMAPRWSLVNDVRESTPAFRTKAQTYLPRFEAETLKDWWARVLMTFAQDHYGTTLTEHVGLVMAEPPALGTDVPKVLGDLAEDIDGEGNHLTVFAHDAFEDALHLGHCVLITDYPDTTGITTHKDERGAQIRPYVQKYAASDVLSWQYVAVGGVRTLVRIVVRERSSETDGAFGIKETIRYRELRQDVTYDETTKRAIGLGAITWRAWEKVGDDIVERGDGFVRGKGGASLRRLPVRIVYGGERLGPLHTKPSLIGLAYSNVEETQVKSDYASVMHKTNVPTPIFIGRNMGSESAGKPVQMGQGIDIPLGGDAKMLEPAGTAIEETRLRLQDIRADMRRQGASTAADEGGKTMTATEAAQYAKSRNAKLARAAQSLQDALEGVLADMAEFLGLPQATPTKSGGSVKIHQDFASAPIDWRLFAALVTMWQDGGLTLEEIRSVAKTGELPETFDPADKAILETLMAQTAAKADQAALAAAAQAESQTGGNAGGGDQTGQTGTPAVAA